MILYIQKLRKEEIEMLADYKNFEDMLDKQWYNEKRTEIIIETKYAIGIIHKFFNPCSKIYVKVPNGLINYKYYFHTWDSKEQEKINNEIKEIVTSIDKETRNHIYNEYLNKQIEYEKKIIEKRIVKMNNLTKANETSQKFIKELENHIF